MTVMFVDLCGSTALSDNLDAEIYGDMLQRLRALGREIIARHGGLIVRVQGDGILALFGQPEAREDDGRRATEAALELHAAMRQLEVDPRRLPRGSLALHTGIHAGLVLLVEGGLELGRYEVLGPVPNVAARLSDQAEFDQILVSEETLGPHAHFFATGTRRVLSVDKGLQPLAVLQVLARAPVHNRFATLALRGLAPFVGRVAEMQALQQQLQAAQAGPARLVQVRAGPGMGKTRLIDEFLRAAVARGHEVHRGYCDGYLGAEPLQPFLQMLRTLFRIGHDTGPADAARLAGHALAEIDTSLVAQRDELLRALSLASPGGDARRGGAELTVMALKTLFERLASRRPVLLFIDDWQWADDASRQVLDALRSLPLPLCLLLATRDQGGSSAERGAVVLELAPLNEDEARQTIDHLLPGTDPFAAAQIHLYGGGNPLFIEELCHSAAVEVPASRPRSSGGGVAWLKSLIESRVSRLPEDQASVARAAAVIGNVFPAWLLERITGHAADSPLLRELARQDFIFPTEQPGGLRFKHGITRDVVYDAVSLRERQAMHRQVAQALAEQAGSGGFDDALEALAYHWGAGGDPAQAARFAAAAGDKAMAVSALDRARAQYRAALTALDEVGTDEPQTRAQWISIVQRLGMACVFDPLGLEDGLSLFERGVQLAARGAGRADAGARRILAGLHRLCQGRCAQGRRARTACAGAGRGLRRCAPGRAGARHAGPGAGGGGRLRAGAADAGAGGGPEAPQHAQRQCPGGGRGLHAGHQGPAARRPRRFRGRACLPAAGAVAGRRHRASGRKFGAGLEHHRAAVARALVGRDGQRGALVAHRRPVPQPPSVRDAPGADRLCALGAAARTPMRCGCCWMPPPGSRRATGACSCRSTTAG